MLTKDEIVLERFNIKLEKGVKQWYTDRAAFLGISMAGYMQLILTQFYENQLNNEAVRNLSLMGTDGDLKEANKNLVEILQTMQEKQENK